MSVENGDKRFLYPLTWFYARAGTTLPKARRIESDDLPQHYRILLVHQREMTAVLEEYASQSIHLRLLQVQSTPQALYRNVLLVEGQGRPVEFGSIHIHLSRFRAKARQQIAEGYLPLGTILRQHQMLHRSRPTAYFRIEPDALICDALGLKGRQILYGRHNLISNQREQVLAEVVEILPPLGEAGDG